MNSSKPAFIATVFVALLAIGVAVFAFMSVSTDEPSHTPPPVNSSAYKPSPDLLDEMYSAAKRLIENNITITELYITHGLPVLPEPYANQDKPLGNPPEDGLFYVDGGVSIHGVNYRAFSDIENIVRETFVADEAARIINNRLDDGEPYYSDYGRIYAEKRQNSQNFTLGINERFALDFHPYPRTDKEFPINWEDASFALVALSDVECSLKIELNINSNSEVVERTMTFTDGEGWRLDRLIYE